jgi:galactokinase
MEYSARIIQAKFKEIFGREPLVIRAPGRINLIGEHTDYNDGFVMPAAVNKEIFFGVAGSADSRSVLYSLNYNERFEIDPGNISPVNSPKWANYLLGVLYKFREQGYSIAPFNCVFGGNVPLGAGMSSSAAMECGFAAALNEFNLLNVPKLDMIKTAQWAEHNFAGVKCGIMDQFASMMGKAGHVIVLDCRSLSFQHAPLDLSQCEIILCDTKVKHSLVDSEYNTRRMECEEGVRILRRHYPEVTSLRDVTMTMLQEHKNAMTGKVFQRCSYVVDEIVRVQEATEDLKKNDLAAFGKKMFETHSGLSHLYEVSCKELDFLVEEASRMQDVVGARMMGGGFGGCTINLVKRTAADLFQEHMTSKYQKAFGIDLPTYKVDIVDGTGRVKEEELSLWT